MTNAFRGSLSARTFMRHMQAALLLLVVGLSLTGLRAVPAQAEDVLPPILVGRLEYAFSGRAEGATSHDYKQQQATVNVRLRWNEEAQSYEDFGSSFSYAGTYDTYVNDTANKVTISWKGSEQGGGNIADDEGAFIGAHIQSDAGQPRELGLSVGRLPIRITGSVTYTTLNVTEETSAESAVTLLCDDRNWLIGKEVPDQPGVFSMACNVTLSGGNATQQTTVSGFLSAPGLKPRIQAIRFEQQDIASGTWTPFSGAEGTVDGNQVRVVATVENPSGVPHTLPVRFLNGETHQPLQEGLVDVALNPGQSAEVTYAWDTEGWAWDRPASEAPEAHPNRAVEVRLGSEAVLYDVWNEPIQVRAKPVFFVHGLNSNAATWAPYTSLLLEANYTWRAFAVPGLRTGNDLIAQEESATLLQNAATLHQYIDQIRREQHAWHVDIVAHSMGGLISRQYIHSFMAAASAEDARVNRPLVRHLVMLGTPNQGSECATWSLVMNTSSGVPNRNAPLQLMPEYVAFFNTEVTRQKGVQFSVLAGHGTPYVCWLPEGTNSDGVVMVPSAHYTYTDIGLTASNHIEMTGSRADFLAWVKPHLISSTGASAQRTTTAPGVSATAVSHPQITQVTGITLAPGETRDIPIVVPAGKNLGVMLRTAHAVSATLRDPSGAAVQTSDRAPVDQEFRSLAVAAPTAGTWILRLASDETKTTDAAVGVGLGESALVARAEVVGSGGERTAQLTLTRSGAPVSGAMAAAQVLRSDGTLTTVMLTDDGHHADGAAGDGVYGTAAGTLGGGAAIIVHVTDGGEQRFVVAVIGGSQEGARIFLPLVRH